MAMGAIVLDLRPGLRIGLFSLGMPICEAFAQIEQQPNIYDVVHVKYFDETLVCGQHSVVIISTTILHVVWTSYLMDRLIRSRSLFCIKLSRSCRFQFI